MKISDKLREELGFSPHWDSGGSFCIRDFEALTCEFCGCLVVQTKQIVEAHVEWHKKIDGLAADVARLTGDVARLNVDVGLPCASEVKW